MACGEVKSTTQLTIRPYTLISGDNPGALITHVQLKGENYDKCSMAIHTALRAKRKFGFVEGTIKCPADTESTFEDWLMINSMVVSWLFNTIEPTLRSQITYVEVAKDLWDDLRQRFSIANGPRIQQLKEDITLCKQLGQPVVTYFGHLKKLWNELGNYERLPVCRCSGCKCGISGELIKRQEADQLHQFIMGLDDSSFPHHKISYSFYGSTSENKYCLFHGGSRGASNQITKQSDARGEAVSFATRTTRSSTMMPQPKGCRIPLECTACLSTTHTVDHCYALHGYPEWWTNLKPTLSELRALNAKNPEHDCPRLHQDNHSRSGRGSNTTRGGGRGRGGPP